MSQSDPYPQHPIQQISRPTFIPIIKSLLTKNLLIIYDNFYKYLLIYSSPFLILLLIVLIQLWADNTVIWEILYPPASHVSTIPKCSGEGCITLAYAVNGQEQPYIQHTIQYIKSSNNLTNVDVKRWNMSLTEILKNLQTYPNKTQAVVVFCTNGFWEVDDLKFPCFAESFHLNSYTIIFNLTLFRRVPFFGSVKEAYPKDMTTIKLKKDIDEATVNITVSDFPKKNSRFITGISIFSQHGSFFIIIPYLILMVVEGSQKLKQKQDRLRIGLNIVGVSHFQFYFSQILVYFINVIILTINFCIGGLLFDIKFWSNALIWFDFIVLMINGFTIGLVSFCITAIVNNKNLGMSVVYGFVLYSIIMQWIFSGVSGGYIIEILYMDDPSFTIKFLKSIFNLYPSYHFTKIFVDISRTAENHFDTLENRYINGRPYTYEDIFYRKSQKSSVRSFTFPNSFQSLLYMLSVFFLYSIILTFLDRYIQSNRGYTTTLFPKLRKKQQSIYSHIKNEQHEVMVQIINVQKRYQNKYHALRGVSTQLHKGEIVGLLGQNGAGKSTLINILVGALSLSGGSITVNGMDVSTQITQIRKIIGVCPQFDILWQQLTAQQHIKMFYQLAGYEGTQQQIKKILQPVFLYQYRKGKIKRFSGGMKRRLSLAISLIGNPKLLILDQPTTGMDAKVRLQTWKIILQFRDRQKTMLITTHNMQQAECLSDRILIMSKGKIIAEGSTVQLKNAYGQGYVIRGTKKGTGEEVSFKCKQSELEKYMDKICVDTLQNWSLQQTALEEVFLNVSSKY